MNTLRDIHRKTDRINSSDDISDQIDLVTSQMGAVIDFAKQYNQEKKEIENLKSYKNALKKKPTSEEEQEEYNNNSKKFEEAMKLKPVVKKKKDALKNLRRRLKELLRATKSK